MTDRQRGRGDNWLVGFVPYQLYRITNSLNQRLRSRLRNQSISVSRWRVLSVLRAKGTLTINEIAELTAMEQPTVSRTVSRLVRDQLVSRRPSKHDSRYMEVSLTTGGERAFKTIYPIAEQHQTDALRGFSEAELDTLRGYLQRLQRNVTATGDDAPAAD